MSKPVPIPPPMRKYKSFGWGETLVNEYESVEWYTNMGKLYPHEVRDKNWLERLFMKEHEVKLEEALRVNRELCREWPRN